jgi:hypothetical protein
METSGGGKTKFPERVVWPRAAIVKDLGYSRRATVLRKSSIYW